MGLLREFQSVLPRPSFLPLRKRFVISQLDYADTIYAQAYNPFFHKKLESNIIQYTQ